MSGEYHDLYSGKAFSEADRKRIRCNLDKADKIDAVKLKSHLDHWDDATKLSKREIIILRGLAAMAIGFATFSAVAAVAKPVFDIFKMIGKMQ